MNDLETRLVGDLDLLAGTVDVDLDAAWATVRERAAGASPVRPVGAPPSRRRRLAVLAAAAAVVVAGTAAVIALAARSGNGPNPDPHVYSQPSTTTPAPATDGSPGTVQGRIAVPPSSATDLTEQLGLAELEWAWATSTERVLRRDDGAAWARVDVSGSAWSTAAAQVGNGADPVDLGGVDGLMVQEFTTWVVTWQHPGGGATLRSSGLDQAAVLALATDLAHGRDPDGWEVVTDLPAWNSVQGTDRFGVQSVVQSTELRPGIDLPTLAIALARVGSEPAPVDVDGGQGWIVDVATNVPGVDHLLLVERDGLAVATTRQDADIDELRRVAADVIVEDVQQVDVPLRSVAAGSLQALARDVHVIERGDVGGRHQWTALRGQPPALPGTATAGGEMWCVDYSDAVYRGGMQAVCGTVSAGRYGVAQIVAGTAVGVADPSVTEAWFVVDGERVDATITPGGALHVIRASLPLGSRVSLHLHHRDGTESAGDVRPDVTLSCSGCPAPVIAPADWIMPTLTASGIELPTTTG